MTREVQGQLSAKDLCVGWWTAPVVDELCFSAPDGSTVLALPEVVGPRGLWSLWWGSADLGEWLLQAPRVELLWRGEGESNLFDAIRRVEHADGKSLQRWLAWLRRRRLALRIDEGVLTFRRGGDGTPWSLGKLNATVETRPGKEAESASLILRPGRIVEKVAVTERVTDDLLKFFAPILAQATRIEGSFTMDVGSLRTEWDDLLAISGEGTLMLHEVRIGPGPILTILIEALGLEGTVRLVEECTVPYRIADHMVEHSGLKFQVGRVALVSSGRVGFDEAIDLEIEVRLPEEPARDGPLARALAGKEILVPLHGTLRRPKLDFKALLSRNRGKFRVMIDEAGGEELLLENVLRSLSERISNRLSEQGNPEEKEHTGEEDSAEPPSNRPRPLRDFLRQRLNDRIEDLRDVLREEEPSPPPPEVPSDA